MKSKFVLNGLRNDDCPCRDCIDRYASCHSKCLRYIDWKQRRNAFLEQRREQYLISDTLYDNQVRRNKKIKQQGGINYGRRGNDTN